MPPDNILSLSEACKLLSISEATGRNWIRLGKLFPREDGKTFEKDYIIGIISNLKNDNSSLLKQRRNKKHVKGRVPYGKYAPNKENMAIIGAISNDLEEYSEIQLRLLIINYALQLILQKNGIINHNNNLLSEHKNNELNLGIFDALLEDILRKELIFEDDIQKLSKLLNHRMVYCSNEDTLGALYLSLRDMTDRKTSGSYYTPYEIVQASIKSLSEQTSFEKKKILDPCCGTGNFLINLNDKLSEPKYLYGWDLDELSVKICRVNISLTYNIIDTDFLYKNFLCLDTLKYYPEMKYDIILGNPPWGLDFTDYDLDSLIAKYKTMSYKGAESYDLFVEKAIIDLSENGLLTFVLPEAILNVRAHKSIRDILIESCSFKFISYIGDPFHKVYCPSIILGVKCDGLGNTAGCQIKKKDEEFVISKNRVLCSDIISLDIADEHWECINAIEKIDLLSCANQTAPNKVFLKDNATFGLGIVTGDNKKYLSEKREDGYENILKGSDIKKYKISYSNNYINFVKKNFQQVAKLEIYRAPEKLLYRYICATPVFAYDDKQTLSLNSCNIVIPKIPGLEIKYVLAILNSRVVKYYLRMKYNSVKLLRSHIESIPIPVADSLAQEEVIKNVNQMLNADASIAKIYEKLDEQIMDLYGLSEDERFLINNSCREKNEFLF